MDVGIWLKKNWWEIHLKKNSVDVSLQLGKEPASVEEMFAYQVYRMIHSVDNQSLPPTIAQFSRNKMIIVPLMEVIHENNNMGSHSPELKWLWPLLNAQSCGSRDQCQAIVIGLLLSCSRQGIFSAWIDTYSHYDFALPTFKALTILSSIHFRMFYSPSS